MNLAHSIRLTWLVQSLNAIGALLGVVIGSYSYAHGLMLSAYINAFLAGVNLALFFIHRRTRARLRSSFARIEEMKQKMLASTEAGFNPLIAHDKIGGVRVLTVVVGVESDWTPKLWATAVFRGNVQSEQRSYKTRAEAEAGHKEFVAAIRRELIEKAKA